MRLEPAGFGDDFVDKMNRWKTQEHAKGRSVRRKMNGHYVKASLLSPTTWRDGVLRRFAAFCGVLRCFTAFYGVLRRVGNKFPLQDQIFWGAQTPAPFSGRLKIIVSN